MTLHARQASLGLTHSINTHQIYPASQLVSHLTGLSIHPNKPIVGAQAFAYTSGMYQAGVLHGSTDAEVLDPADIGFLGAENAIPLLTGREGLRRRLIELGFSLNDAEFERVYERFRSIASKKSNLEISDLEAIVSGQTTVFMPRWRERRGQSRVGRDARSLWHGARGRPRGLECHARRGFGVIWGNKRNRTEKPKPSRRLSRRLEGPLVYECVPGF